MSIQEKRGVLHIVAFAILLSTMVATNVASKLEEQPPLLAYLIDSGVINLEMAELLRDNCMLELLHAQKTLQDLEFHFVEKKSSNSGELLNGRLSGTKMHDAVNALIPQVNQILVDCVRGKNRMLRDAVEAQSSYSWYTRYLGFLYNLRWSSTRRVLAQTPGAAPAPSPAVSSPSPAPSVPLSPTEIPGSLPSVPFFPTDYNSSNLQPTAAEQTNASSNQKTSKRTVIIAVVVTASVTFVIAALLFIFCRKCCGAGSGRGKNDERPLLSLSLSDYSIASSQKPFSLETPVNEEKLGNQSFNSKLNHNSISGNFYVESHSLSSSKIDIPVRTSAGAATNFVENSLQMPPRMLGTPGLPPLKPPPGRTDPPKPPPENATSPLPTAPVPPRAPPIKSSSGEPRPLPPGPPPPPPIPSRAKAGARPPPPPMPNGAKAGAPPPPPPPGAGVPPPRPPPIGLKPPRNVPPGPRHPTISTQESEAGTSKAKLKPFFWDKVLANPDHSMVWHQIKSGSFQFNEEMIETLFGYAPPGNNKNEAKKESSPQDVLPKYIQLIDPKKSQNLSITLKALNVTTEVCDALEEGNELPSELIQTLLKMAPTSEEELKLRLYSGELSQLGPAERFLKVLVDIPFAFKRLESLHFMCTLQEDISTLNESFAVLEAACTELRKSRLFFKLLEAVLKTGNRMNDGTFRGGAQAFKLDTLLKLSDVKGTDGKTTLLHFVVQEIIRSEGIKAARAAKETRSVSGIKSDVLEETNQASDEHLRSLGLEVVSGLGNELENVKKAAVLDADSLTGTVARLGHALEKSRNFLNSDMKNVSEENGFHQMLRSFVRNAEVDVMWSREEVKRIMELVKNTADYFHGNSGKDEGLRLFVIVRDFLIILDKVCKEVKIAAQKSSRTSKKEDTESAPPDPRQTTTPDPRQRLFPAIADRRIYTSSSSDDES